MNKIFPRSKILDIVDFLTRMFPFALSGSIYMTVALVIVWETLKHGSSNTGLMFVFIVCLVPPLFVASMVIMVFAVLELMEKTQGRTKPPDPPTPPTAKTKKTTWTRVYEDNKHTWNIHNDDKD